VGEESLTPGVSVVLAQPAAVNIRTTAATRLMPVSFAWANTGVFLPVRLTGSRSTRQSWRSEIWRRAASPAYRDAPLFR